MSVRAGNSMGYPEQRRSIVPQHYRSLAISLTTRLLSGVATPSVTRSVVLFAIWIVDTVPRSRWRDANGV